MNIMFYSCHIAVPWRQKKPGLYSSLETKWSSDVECVLRLIGFFLCRVITFYIILFYNCFLHGIFCFVLSDNSFLFYIVRLLYNLFGVLTPLFN